MNDAKPADGSWWRRCWRQSRTEASLVVAVLVVIGLTIVLDPTHSYLQKPGENATDVLRQTAMLGILALGAAVVIISGGIDLSAGSVVAFSGVVFTSLIIAMAPVDARGTPQTQTLAWWVLPIAGSGTLAIGFLIGSLHAWLITVVRLPPFVATLATLAGLRSLARVLIKEITAAITKTANSQIYVYDFRFGRLGKDWWIPALVFAVLAFVTWVWLSRTVSGRHLYAMGGNETAAKLSGIRTDRLKWLAYSFSSMTAALGGVLYTSFVSGADPAIAGIGLELDAIAASVVGGCNLAGGIGTVPGVALGALFLRVVIDAIAKIVPDPDVFQGLIVGVLVVLAVTFSEFRGQRGIRRRLLTGGLGVVTWLNLTALTGLLVGVLVRSHKLTAGFVSATLVGVALIGLAIWEQKEESRP